MAESARAALEIEILPGRTGIVLSQVRKAASQGQFDITVDVPVDESQKRLLCHYMRSLGYFAEWDDSGKGLYLSWWHSKAS